MNAACNHYRYVLANPHFGWPEDVVAEAEEARAAELAAPGARLGVLTHEITRMQRVLEQRAAGWRRVGEHRFFQKGHHPRLFLLER